ncbi:MAG: hypothetical protein ABL909_04560 [Sphingopyxis sp.]
MTLFHDRQRRYQAINLFGSTITALMNQGSGPDAMMTEQHANQIKHDLQGRISALAETRGRMSQRQLVEDVDAIRSVAQNHGFTTVSCIAAKLESALARDNGGSTLLCFLDALHDAVKLEPIRGPAQQALLASIALRMG